METFLTACRMPSRDPRGRAGFSLVELLVASMLSLIVMGAVAGLFAEFSKSVSEGRAISDLNSRVRVAAWRLRQDLVGLTCVPAPFVRVEANAGYFQVDGGGVVSDVLALTTSSPGAPFRGRLEGAQGFESPTAEVVWFSEPTIMFKGRQLYNLHRRQLLVAATPDAGDYVDNIFAPPDHSDLSYGTFPVVPDTQHANSLGDLSKPTHRFVAKPRASWKLVDAPGHLHAGEDVILGNVLAFDVKIVTQTGQANTYPIVPSDGTIVTLPNGDPTLPPLRSVEVTIRCLEPAANQEREMKVVHSFGQERNPVQE